MGREEGGTDGIVSQLGKAVVEEVGSEEVGREVEAKVGAICGRAWQRKDQLDAGDALGYHVRLILDNSEASYREVREIVGDHLTAVDPCPVCGGSNTAGPGLVGQNTECPCCGPGGTVKRHPHQLGDALQEYAERLAGLEGVEEPDGEGIVRGEWGGPHELDAMAREILNTAFAWVDWGAVARVYLSEVEEIEPDVREAC